MVLSLQHGAREVRSQTDKSTDEWLAAIELNGKIPFP